MRLSIVLFFCGAVILGVGGSLVNNLIITRRALKSSDAKRLMVASLARIVVCAAVMALAYFAGRQLLPSPLPPLVGAVLGLTIPSFFLAKNLVKPDRSNDGR